MDKKYDIDDYLKIHEYTEKEISRIRNFYILLFTALTIISSVGIFWFVKIVANDRQELKERYEKSISELNADYKRQTSLYETEINENYKQLFTELKDKLERKVETEFDNVYIKNLVEEKAKERIDLIADRLIHESILKEIDPVKNDLIDFEEEINSRMTNLLLNTYIMDAYNGSRGAFEELQRLSNKEDFIRNRYVKQQLEHTILKLDRKIKERIPYFYKLDSEIFEFNIEELSNYYFDIITDGERWYFVKLFLKDINIEDKIKIELSKKILEKDQYLLICYYIGLKLISLYNLELPAYEFNEILDFLKK